MIMIIIKIIIKIIIIIIMIIIIIIIIKLIIIIIIVVIINNNNNNYNNNNDNNDNNNNNDNDNNNNNNNSNNNNNNNNNKNTNMNNSKNNDGNYSDNKNNNNSDNNNNDNNNNDNNNNDNVATIIRKISNLSNTDTTTTMIKTYPQELISKNSKIDSEFLEEYKLLKNGLLNDEINLDEKGEMVFADMLRVLRKCGWIWVYNLKFSKIYFKEMPNIKNYKDFNDDDENKYFFKSKEKMVKYFSSQFLTYGENVVDIVTKRISKYQGKN